METQALVALTDRLRAEVSRVVVGQDRALDLLLVALLAEGHVLLEGVPGTAKTLLAKSFANSLSLTFRRAQFTPDLMPSDIIGTRIFDFTENRFVLARGPIFTEVLLADELNRTPPKTQAALLEAMEERRVSLGGETHDLGEAFLVIATQNPVEMEGTYPLPEAQLDRFLFRVPIEYPSEEAERAILDRHGSRKETAEQVTSIVASLDTAGLQEARAVVRRVTLAEDVRDYIVAIVRATRNHPDVVLGASPRAATMLAAAARARAALEGAEYVLPDIVQELAVPALAHRLTLDAGSTIEGRDPIRVLEGILAEVPAPR